MRIWKWEIISREEMVKIYREVQNLKTRADNHSKDVEEAAKINSDLAESLQVQGNMLLKFKQKALVNHPITGKMVAFRKMTKPEQERFFIEDERGR